MKQQLKSKQIEVLLDVTTFKSYKTFNGSNRPINESHVKEIMQSLRLFGPSSAILRVLQTRAVTGKLERYLADGQHTKIAAERLEMPLTVIVVELNEDTLFNVTQYIAMLNNTSKAWSTKNYVNAFSSNEIMEYKVFSDTIVKEGLKITDLQIIFNVTPKAFKSGNMQFPDLNDSYELLDAVKMVKDFVPKAYARRSLYKVLRMAKDYKRMAKKIKQAAILLKDADTNFSENETELYNHFVKLYQTEFKVK